jgi:hypothetical protein
MGIFKDLKSMRQETNTMRQTTATLRQQAKQVQRPTMRDTIESKRKDPSKFFQASPAFEKTEDVPQYPATATIVASRRTDLLKDNDMLVALSLLVVPTKGRLTRSWSSRGYRTRCCPVARSVPPCR